MRPRASASAFWCWLMMASAGIQAVGLFLLPVATPQRVIGVLFPLAMMFSMPIWWKRANGRTEWLFLSLNIALAMMVLGSCRYDLYLIAVEKVALYLLLLDGAILFFGLFAKAFEPWWIRSSAATVGLAGAILMASMVQQIVRSEFKNTPHFSEVGSLMTGNKLGYDIQGYAQIRQYFPSDPRSYFSRFEQDRLNPWHLWQLRRELDQPEPRSVEYSGVDHVRLDPGTKRRKDSNIDFGYPHWLAEPFFDHVMRFRIRADRPADAELVPHELNPYRELERRPLRLTPEWQWVEIRPDRVDRPTERAVAINLAMTNTPVELDSLEILRNGEADTRFQPMTRYWVQYQMNRHGFRGKDLAIPKPRGTRRIACLGDSFTYGQGVQQEDVYCSVLERMLNEPSPSHADGPAEVLNAGRCGYSTYEERAILDEYVVQYEPDLVVLQMLDNDIENHTNLIGTPQPRTYPLLVEQAKAIKERVESAGAKFAILLFRVAPMSPGWTELYRALEALPAGTVIIDVGKRVEPYLGFGRDGFFSFCVHPFDHHPNEKGHRFAAEALKEAIDEHRLIQRASEWDLGEAASRGSE
jgi:lysophospholipase L1-like esterase